MCKIDLPLLIFLLPLAPEDTASHMKIVSRNKIKYMKQLKIETRYIFYQYNV